MCGRNSMNKPSKAKRPSAFNAELHEWVTSGIFQMTLTKRQIAFMTAAYVNDCTMAEQRREGKPSRFVSTVKELEARGLLNHIGRLTDVQELANKEGFLRCGDWLLNQPFNRVYILTRAGRLMCEVLKEANLIDPNLVEAPEFPNPTKPRKPTGDRKWLRNVMARKPVRA